MVFFVEIVTVVIRYIRSKHGMGEPIAAIDDARDPSAYAA